MSAAIWEVIGGADKGGILVRAGLETTSDRLAERLSTGAFVRELAVKDDRLHYERLTGSGPASGWVSVEVQGKPLLARLDAVWEVVGGGDKGGIVVRNGQDTASPLCTTRLATGSLVKELRLEGLRLQYQRISGGGPEHGWVSTRLENNKELLVRVAAPTQEAPSDGATGSRHGAGGAAAPNAQRSGDDELNPYKVLGVAPDVTDAMIKSAFRKASLKVHPDHCPDDPDAAAKFLQLTEVKNFLLDPRKRRAYNLSHGLLQQTVNVKWWSSWEDIFEEIVPSWQEEDAALEAESIPAPVPEQSGADLVVYGATGIVGTLACGLLQRHLSSHSWVAAGRNEHRLQLLQQKFGPCPHFRGTVRAESPEELERLAKSARLVLDLSGPKFRVGGAVAEACIRAGAHYVDSTGCAGDALAARQVRDKLDGKAKEAGVALAYFCGWSSTQVDFGVWQLVRHLRERHGVPTRRVDVYRWFQGGNCWGGTHLLAYRGPDGLDGLLTSHGGPFLLGGERSCGVRKEDEDEKHAVQDKYSGMWVAVDSPPDNVVPRCTCALFDGSPDAYGDNFLYKNWGLFPDKHMGSMALLQNKFLRSGYEKAVAEEKIPPPGMGAKERLRQESCVTMIFVAEADEPGEDPRRAYCTMSTGPGGMGDPYECTAVVAVEAALCLLDAVDNGGPEESVLRSGFGTPAYHLAHLGFLERLVARGNTYKIEDGPPPAELFRNVVMSAASITG